MSPKHKLITLSWCVATMLATMILSHGHLIMKEILTHWPQSESWEGRLETALYTQGGLGVAASIVISAALLVRSHLSHRSDDRNARRELAFRERHERAAAERHDKLLSSLNSMAAFTQGGSVSETTAAKKSQDSGGKPR